MMKPNSADGFGNDGMSNTDAGKHQTAWPKSSNWNERLKLSDEKSAQLSDALDVALAQLEEAFEDFITVNSTRNEFREGR